MKRFGTHLLALALFILSVPVAFGQSASDPAARAEIRRLRDRVQELAKQAANPPRPVKDSATIERVAALERSAAQQPTTPEWAKWILPLLLGAGVAYLVAKATATPVLAVAEATTAGSNGKPNAAPDFRRLELLSHVRTGLDDLESATRRHASHYPLLAALQGSTTIPLQRLAELSSREQEGLIQMQIVSSQIRSLAHEYGEVPPEQRDPSAPDHLGDWMTHWWQRVETQLSPTLRNGSPQEPLDPLFREAREKVLSLANQERSSIGFERG